LRNGLDVYSLWQLARIIRREDIQIIHQLYSRVISDA